MEDRARTPGAAPTPAALLMLARELRDAAELAGRPDVVARVNEVIAAITGPDRTADDRAGQQQGGDGGNVVVRILDGLGF